jgi:hypothetical protein
MGEFNENSEKTPGIARQNYGAVVMYVWAPVAIRRPLGSYRHPARGRISHA